MDALAVSLDALVKDKGLEVLYNRDDLLGGLSGVFSNDAALKPAVDACTCARLFAHAYYKKNVNEILFMRRKTISDMTAAGIAQTDATRAANGFVALAERVRGIEILKNIDEKNEKSYELLAAAARSYEKSNYKPALMVFNSLVNAEFTEAHYYLGKVWYEGRAVAQDYSRAAKCFDKGLKAGSSYCTYFYGSCLLKGIGIKRDPDRGTELLMKAVEMGQEDAAFAVGYMFKDNPKEIKKAIQCLQTSADYGNWSAAITIIDLYYEDAKTTGNFHKTSEARERLAKVTDAESCFKIAQIYERGIGVPASVEKALNYSAKAAAKGHKAASEMMTRVGNKKLGRV